MQRLYNFFEYEFYGLNSKSNVIGQGPLFIHRACLRISPICKKSPYDVSQKDNKVHN